MMVGKIVQLTDDPAGTVRAYKAALGSGATIPATEAKKGNGRKPSKTELLFEAEYLERRLEDGKIIFWLREPAIRLIGQTYTPDYMELTTNGTVNFVEVKGSFKLGSEDRSSVKIRWTQSIFGNEAIRFFWARRLDSGQWRMREIKTRREKAR